ncbi:MAG: lmo0937 family membrane protein [Chloroflexia bacterium]
MEKQPDWGIWGLVGALAGLGVLGFVLGWGSGLVHILGVLVVMLALYELLKRRGTRRP